MTNPPDKNPPGLGSRIIALLLNLIGTGAGHIFLGQWRRGILWFGGYLLLLTLFGVFLIPLGSASFTALAVLCAIVFSLPYLGPTIDVFLIPQEKLTKGPIWLVALAVIASAGLSSGAAWVIRSQRAEAFRVPSGAMSPTMMIGDHMFVDKSTTWDGPDGDLQRGDVIVFQYPDPDPNAPRQNYVKRLFGLPGDTIEERSGHIYINGEQLKRCSVGRMEINRRYPISGELFVEFAGERSYLVLQQDDQPEDWGPFRVPDGELFVLGDNRDASSDSRRWNSGQGAGVPFSLVHGRSAFIWLAYEDEQLDFGRLGLNINGSPMLPFAAPETRQAIADCLAAR